MTAEASEKIDLHKFFGKVVSINVDTGQDETGARTFNTVTGKVTWVSDIGLVLRSRSTVTIVEAKDILDIEEESRKRKRIVRRWVRVIGPSDSAKQHLADRHGILVSVLSAADEDTARQMHEHINHEDLGHQHGNRPNSTFVDSAEAEDAIHQLDATEDEG